MPEIIVFTRETGKARPKGTDGILIATLLIRPSIGCVTPRIVLRSYNGIGPLPMRCPKCQFDHPLQTTDCLKCGIVFSRYKAALESAANQANPDVALAVSAAPALAGPATAANDALSRADARTELRYRIFALPLALLLARLVAATPLRMAAAMLAMVLHESGHAIRVAHRPLGRAG